MIVGQLGAHLIHLISRELPALGAAAGHRARPRPPQVLDAALRKSSSDLSTIVRRRLIHVLCDILGVPASDQKLLIDLGDRMFGNTDPQIADVLLDSEASEQFRLLPFRSPAAEMFE